MTAGPRRVLGAFAEALRDRIEEKLPYVSAPTLVVRGSHDRLVPQERAEEVTRLLPYGRLAVVRGAGHMVPHRRPEELARLVGDFLASPQQPRVARGGPPTRPSGRATRGRPGRSPLSTRPPACCALSRFLDGRDSRAVGQVPPVLELPLSGALGALGRLPVAAREKAYAAAGRAGATPLARIDEVRSEALATWVTDHYPRRRYPVILIGSGNGALTHPAAALDAAWLPQTLLLPVRRRGVAVDDPRGDLSAVSDAGRALLAANPDLVVHHMHDPDQTGS